MNDHFIGSLIWVGKALIRISVVACNNLHTITADIYKGP